MGEEESNQAYQISESGANNRDPKPKPKRKVVTPRVATICEHPKSCIISGRAAV